jgi:hypothetical protein
MDDTPQIRVRKFSRSKKALSEETSKIHEPKPEAHETYNTLSPIPEEEVEHNDEEDFLADLKNHSVEETIQLQTPPPSPTKSVSFNSTPIDIPPPSSLRKRGKKPTGIIFGGNNEFADLFGDPTPILGKNRREQLTRVHEFKALFPNELKHFKIKPKATDEEIEDAIREMETIVSCGGIQNMLNEALLTAIQVTEGISSRTQNFDITGTANALRQNPEFYRLCKLCWIKYKVFSNCPPEFQLALIVGSTALMMRQQNSKKKVVSSMLNTPL